MFTSCNGLVSLAPIPPHALASTDPDQSNPDLTLYCASPITEDYPSPPGSGCHQTHEDLFNISLNHETNQLGILFGAKDLESFNGRKFGRDPVLSSKSLGHAVHQQQHQQQLQHLQRRHVGNSNNRVSSPFMANLSTLNGGQVTPTPPMTSSLSMTSYDGIKYLTEEELDVNLEHRMSFKKSPKEEPNDSDVTLQISMYNM